jgi:hypothetical protein
MRHGACCSLYAGSGIELNAADSCSLYAALSVLVAVCVLLAVCGNTLNARSRSLYARLSVLLALCALLYARYSDLYAPCSMLGVCGVERVARCMRVAAWASVDELYALARSKPMRHRNRPLCHYMHTYTCMRLLSLKRCMRVLALKAPAYSSLRVLALKACAIA